MMTQDQQEADLAAAARLLHPTKYTADRCRHESVTETSLWVFDGRRQVGSITHAQPDAWQASRVVQGMPTSARKFSTLADAVSHIINN
jgi:hypothetical protein